MNEFIQFFLKLDPLVLGMGAFGVFIIVSVLILNAVQMRRAKARDQSESVAAAPEPALQRAEPRMTPTVQEAGVRIEPSLRANTEDDFSDPPINVPSPASTKANDFIPEETPALSPERKPKGEVSAQAFAHAAQAIGDPQVRQAHEVDIELPTSSRARDLEEAPALPLGPTEPTAPIDTRVHSVVKLRFANPLAANAAKAMTDQIATHFPRGLIWTWSADLGAWAASKSPAAQSHPANVIAFAMPLASRHGAVTETVLREWMAAVANGGEAVGGEVVYASVHEDAKRAVELDQFCGNLDLMAGVNLMRADRSAMPGTRVRGTLEAEGFRLLPEGFFQLMSDDGSHPLYEIKSLHNQAMSAESLRHEGVHGLALTLDVMRVPNPVPQFDLMRSLSKRLALRLEATVVDDRGHALSDAQFATIRRELEARVTAARTAGIEPGSPLARTLFGD
jgi:hypothetical protein